MSQIIAALGADFPPQAAESADGHRRDRAPRPGARRARRKGRRGKVSVTRKDLSVIVAGVKMTTDGSTSGAAFKRDGKDDMVMGPVLY